MEKNRYVSLGKSLILWGSFVGDVVKIVDEGWVLGVREFLYVRLGLWNWGLWNEGFSNLFRNREFGSLSFLWSSASDRLCFFLGAC